MRSSVSVVCFAAAFLASSLVQAATIAPVQGDLSLNQGQGFQRVNTRVEANVGDSVMVGPGGAATVTYPDGCQVNVQPGAVVSIAPLSPCASGSFAQDQGQTSSGLNAGTLLFGAAALGATGVAVYGITQSQPSSPASP